MTPRTQGPSTTAIVDAIVAVAVLPIRKFTHIGGAPIVAIAASGVGAPSSRGVVGSPSQGARYEYRSRSKPRFGSRLRVTQEQHRQQGPDHGKVEHHESVYVGEKVGLVLHRVR